MRTDRVALLTLTLALAIPAALRAQDALTGIGEGTEVGAIEFRFEDHQTLPEEELQQRIALTEPGGLAGLRNALDFIPLIPPVGVHPFDPLELQRDAIRLRHHYNRSGFPRARVHYDVRYDAKSDRVNIAFVIREGPPLLVETLNFAADSGPLVVPTELQTNWGKFTARQQQEAERWGDTERRALADSAARWFRHAGYPFAVARAAAIIDTARNRADVTVRVRSGTRARIGEIVVTGTTTVSAKQLTRPLPIQRGDWYDGPALENGRQQLVQMDIVRHATLELPDSDATDSGRDHQDVRADQTEDLEEFAVNMATREGSDRCRQVFTPPTRWRAPSHARRHLPPPRGHPLLPPPRSRPAARDSARLRALQQPCGRRVRGSPSAERSRRLLKQLQPPGLAAKSPSQPH
jgi:hypothetical protein